MNNLKKGVLSTLLLSVWILSGNASASELPREAVLPLETAVQAVNAALAQCRKDGYKVSVAVVDKGGVVRAQMRDDGAGVHTIDSSRRKAYTAVSMGRPTQFFAELVTRVPSIEGIRDMNASILILGGGIPVKIGGEVVGGIGVGGAPGAKLDEVCARAGLKAIGAELYEPSE